MVEAPSALIYGGDNFIAKRLAELLMSRGITVFWDEDEVGKPLYFFDFGPAVAGLARYQEMLERKVKICLVDVEQKISGDFRIVNLHNVYGVGMSRDSWYGQVVELAARNKNLVLPKYGEKFRLLAVDDACEAVMRAVIMSGTSGKIFEIEGKETDSKEVASVLIDLAKMTKTTIHEIGLNPPQPPFDKGGEEYAVEISAKALRWKPVVEFREGIKEAVAEAVARVDEEGRNKNKLKIKNYELRIGEEKEEEPRMGMVVEVEDPPTLGNYGEPREEEKKEEPEIKIEPEVKIKEREIVVEEDEVEEEKTVGKKIEWGKVEPIKKVYQMSDIRFQKEDEKVVEVKKETVEVKMVPPTAKAIRRAGFPWKWVGIGLGTVVLVIGLVYGWFLWEVVSVAMNLDKPIKLLEERRVDEAKKLIEKYQIRNKNGGWFWAETKLGEIVKISQEVLEVESKLSDLADSMEKINGAIFEEKTINFKQELSTIIANLLEVETKMGVIEARLSEIKKWIPGRWRGEIDKASDLISKNVDLVSKVRQMTSVLPEILGLDGKRRDYLVLLQNEMELRATGGFIGSYGVLSFQEGRLISFDIKDVYEADGQLSGHVEPPEEIKRYLGEAGWFMRDANWKASFPQATKDIAWFFEKEMGRKVDGVIGVDLAVIKAMLNATGEIYVPDFKEKVNKDNLYEQAEFYSESKFFPGSVQKASFLSGVGKQMFLEVSTLKTGQRWNLLMGLAEALEKNDLQIVLNEPVAAEVMASLGWDGEIFLGGCGATNCYSDYLYVVESNLGVNKANYFLYRNLEQKVEIKESSVERILRINYENMAKSTSWPGGDYKNYLRIYLPKDVQVSEVTVTTGGQKQNIALDQVKMVNVSDKRELGFLVMVPISKKVVVEVKYGSSFTQMKDKFSYLLYIQRQPGFGDTGIVNLVSMPNGYQPMQVSPSASVVGGKLLFNQKLDRDIKMGVEISK